MGRICTKMPSFGLNKIRPLGRVRSTSNHAYYATNADQEKGESFSGVAKDVSGGGYTAPRAATGREIMIVVDSSIEAKNAVQWALGHVVQKQDIVLLLYVTRPSKQAKKHVFYPRIPEFLICMKSMCQLKWPEVRFEVEVVEGVEKGAAIVEAAKRHEVALLVVGQKKRWVAWRLMVVWTGNRAAAGGVPEYCVQNAGCMAVAVRRKSKKVGGYLITTKKHRDFWLLA